MAKREKFEPLEVRPVRLIALMYFAVLLSLGAGLVIWTFDIYKQILNLNGPREIFEHGTLLWLAIMLPLGIFGWMNLFLRVALDVVTGRPLAKLTREGLTARSSGVFARFRNVEWKNITSISESRASRGTVTLAALLPFRVTVQFEHHERSTGVIVGGHRKQREQTVKGTLKIPTSYADLKGFEIKHLLDRYHREFGDPATFSEREPQSIKQPFSSLTDGIQFPQHTVSTTSLQPDDGKSNGSN